MFARILLAAVLVVASSVNVYAQFVAPAQPPEYLMESAAPEEQAPRLSLLSIQRAGDEVTASAVDSGTNGDIFMTSPSPFTLSGVLLQAKADWPFVTARTGTSDFQSAFTVYNAAAAEMMRVQGDGKVGIGTNNPGSRLALFSNTVHHLTLQSNNPSVWHLTNYNIGFFGITKDNGSASLAILNDGKVGINTTTPGAPLTVHSTTANQLRLTSSNATAWELLNSGSGYFGITAVGAATPALTILNNGNLGLGTNAPAAKLHVNGNVLVTGSITGASVIGSIYQDVAEWVPATSDMEPGTVVVLNEERTNEVMASHRAYDTSVAGVVSAQPGVLLGVAGDSKEQIATTGRVRVRVDATTAPIRIGDLLVTSDKTGRAMRSEAMEIGGRKFHQPGTIVGKALEPLESGVGEILVLLSLQ